MLIGEVAARSGVSARMLRHYDRIGLVSPSVRTSGGYRDYTNADIQRLFHVEGLRTLGLGLPEVAAVLDDPAFQPRDMVAQLTAQARARIAREEALLRTLERVQASAPRDWAEVLQTIGLLRGLESPEASERLRAALRLDGADAGGPDVAPVVAAALAETDLNAAGALDWALAQRGDAAVPLLAAALEDPALDDPALGDPGLGDPARARRHRAVEALRKIGSGPALRALAAATRHPDPVVQARAAIAAGMLGNLEAVPDLLALVAAGRDDVEAGDVLAERAAAAPHAAERIAADLAAALTRADDAGRYRLVALLADLPGDAATEILSARVSDPAPRVARTAQALLDRR